MTETQPEIRSGRKFSAIWIIPVVALAIGIYLVIHTRLTEGPEITITFRTAEGLEAGKTKVQYRNVSVGQVEDVDLSEDKQSVIATVKLELEATSLLREDTRFWVVRARVGLGAVSGLGTLLSGAYIQLDPGAGTPVRKRDFTGLEEPPLTPADAPGLRLVLYSENAGSVGTGDPILFNGYRVGRIESAKFDSRRREMRYDAFIDAPYDQLVTTSSRFWNVSGISAELSASGIQIQTGSLESMVIGGVAFGTLPGMPPGEKPESGAEYALNASYSALQDDPYQYSVYFITSFEQSLRGLEPGAPVEFRGIKVGEVKRILFKELVGERLAGRGRPIPVLIFIEPGRFGLPDTIDTADKVPASIAKSVQNGLRASLQTGNILTGKLFVSLDFYPDAEPVAPSAFDDHPVIPSIPGGFERLEHQVGTLLEKLNDLPLQTTVSELNASLATLNAALASTRLLLDDESTRELPRQLSEVVADLQASLGQLSPDSEIGKSLSSSVYELNATLRNLQDLTRTLSEQPSSILIPMETARDPIPEANPR